MQATQVSDARARAREAPPQPDERGWLPSAAVLAVVAAVVLAFFLSIYVRQQIPVPLGWDTSRYLWETAMVQEHGLSSLDDPLPPPFRPSLSRPGFPVLAGTLSSLTTASTFRIAAVLPSVLAVVIGLAAGAFISATLRRPLWQLAVVALGVATSAYAVRLAAPEAYQDNLASSAILLAALIPLAFSVTGAAWGAVAAAVLLGAAGVVHWAFFAFFAAVLGLTALAYAPLSWRAWRDGAPLTSTPAARVGGALIGGALIGGVTIYGLLGARPDRPKLSVSEFRKKFRRDLPTYRLPYALSVAAVGAGALAARLFGRRRDDRPGERAGAGFVLRLTLSWLAVVLIGVVAFRAGMRLPAHRFLAFALAVPILAALGVVTIGAFLARIRRLPRGVAVVAAAAAMAAVIGVSAFFSYRAWENQPTWARMEQAKVEQAATVGRYLDERGVPDGRPVVFVIDDRGPNPDAYVGLMAHMVRASLPVSRLDDVYFYVGTPQNYLRGRPTTSDTAALYDNISARLHGAIERVRDQRPLAFITAALNDHSWGDWIAANPDSWVGPDVAVVEGPAAAEQVGPPPLPVGRFPAWKLGAIAAAVLAALGLVGLGWAGVLVPGRLRRFELLAIAPAVGVGALVLAGVLADRVGIRLVGAPGAAVALAAGVAGWSAWWWISRQRAEEGSPAGA